MFFRIAGLLWQKVGPMVMVLAAVSAVGWFWSTVLLALAIHRLQRIPALSAATVVILTHLLGLAIVCTIVFALRGPIAIGVTWLVQTGMAARVGGPVH